MRIVYVTSRFPFPVEKGDKLRAFHQIRILSRHHEIHLVAISHKAIPQAYLDAMKPYCASVKVFRIKEWLLPLQILSGWLEGLPLQVSYFLDKTIKRKVQYHIINIEPDHVICQLIRAAGYVRALPFQKTLDYMDVFSEGMRQMGMKYRIFRFFFLLEAKRLAAYERTIYKDFDHHIIISSQDRDRLTLPFKNHIAVIPNGVDTAYWKREEHSQPRYDLVFVGNLGYGPNRATASYVIKKILPVLRRKHGMIHVLLAGARPGKDVVRLGQLEGVKVHGWVEDIRKAYQDGRIFVAPMFSGLGLQNKILEAMSMQLPCVTSSMVNNAIGAIPGKHLLVADNVEDFVSKIEYLMAHPDELHKIAAAGREFVIGHFNWEDQVEKMNKIIFTKNEFVAE